MHLHLHGHMPHYITTKHTNWFSLQIYYSKSIIVIHLLVEVNHNLNQKVKVEVLIKYGSTLQTKIINFEPTAKLKKPKRQWFIKHFILRN